MAETSQSSEPDQCRESLRRRYLLKRFWHRLGILDGERSLLGVGAFRHPAPGHRVGCRRCLRHERMEPSDFDGLQNRDAAAVGRLSLLYFAILAISVLLGVVQVYFRIVLQRRWRAWLTDHLIDRWLAHGRYYQLNLVAGDHANPEFRIADDVRIATESPVDFVNGVTQALLSAATF